MIRWPKMQAFDILVLRRSGAHLDLRGWAKIRHWIIVERDWENDRVWVAPRWIGWLYRLLPNHANVNLTGRKTEPGMYRANVAAPSWLVGIVMRSGIPAIHCWFGSWERAYYLPWGVRLYMRMVEASKKKWGGR